VTFIPGLRPVASDLAQASEEEPGIVLGALQTLGRLGFATRNALAGEFGAAAGQLAVLGSQVASAPFTGGLSLIDPDISVLGLSERLGGYGVKDLAPQESNMEASDLIEAWGGEKFLQGIGADEGWGRVAVDVLGGVFSDPLSLVSGGTLGLGRRSITGAEVAMARRSVAKGLATTEKGQAYLRAWKAANPQHADDILAAGHAAEDLFGKGVLRAPHVLDDPKLANEAWGAIESRMDELLKEGMLPRFTYRFGGRERAMAAGNQAVATLINPFQREFMGAAIGGAIGGLPGAVAGAALVGRNLLGTGKPLPYVGAFIDRTLTDLGAEFSRNIVSKFNDPRIPKGLRDTARYFLGRAKSDIADAEREGAMLVHGLSPEQQNRLTQHLEDAGDRARGMRSEAWAAQKVLGEKFKNAGLTIEELESAAAGMAAPIRAELAALVTKSRMPSLEDMENFLVAAAAKDPVLSNVPTTRLKEIYDWHFRLMREANADMQRLMPEMPGKRGWRQVPRDPLPGDRIALVRGLTREQKLAKHGSAEAKRLAAHQAQLAEYQPRLDAWRQATVENEREVARWTVAKKAADEEVAALERQLEEIDRAASGGVRSKPGLVEAKQQELAAYRTRAAEYQAKLQRGHEEAVAIEQEAARRAQVRAAQEEALDRLERGTLRLQGAKGSELLDLDAVREIAAKQAKIAEIDRAESAARSGFRARAAGAEGEQAKLFREEQEFAAREAAFQKRVTEGEVEASQIQAHAEKLAAERRSAEEAIAKAQEELGKGAASDQLLIQQLRDRQAKLAEIRRAESLEQLSKGAREAGAEGEKALAARERKEFAELEAKFQARIKAGEAGAARAQSMADQIRDRRDDAETLINIADAALERTGWRSGYRSPALRAEHARQLSRLIEQAKKLSSEGAQLAPIIEHARTATGEGARHALDQWIKNARASLPGTVSGSELDQLMAQARGIAGPRPTTRGPGPRVVGPAARHAPIRERLEREAEALSNQLRPPEEVAKARDLIRQAQEALPGTVSGSELDQLMAQARRLGIQQPQQPRAPGPRAFSMQGGHSPARDRLVREVQALERRVSLGPSQEVPGAGLADDLEQAINSGLVGENYGRFAQKLRTAPGPGSGALSDKELALLRRGLKTARKRLPEAPSGVELNERMATARRVLDKRPSVPASIPGPYGGPQIARPLDQIRERIQRQIDEARASVPKEPMAPGAAPRAPGEFSLRELRERPYKAETMEVLGRMVGGKVKVKLRSGEVAELKLGPKSYQIVGGGSGSLRHEQMLYVQRRLQPWVEQLLDESKPMWKDFLQARRIAGREDFEAAALKMLEEGGHASGGVLKNPRLEQLRKDHGLAVSSLPALTLGRYAKHVKVRTELELENVARKLPEFKGFIKGVQEQVIPGGTGGIAAAYAKTNRRWKAMLTSVNPAYHSRNWLGALFQVLQDPDITHGQALRIWLHAGKEVLPAMSNWIGYTRFGMERSAPKGVVDTMIRAAEGDRAAWDKLGKGSAKGAMRVGEYPAQEVLQRAIGRVMKQNQTEREVLGDLMGDDVIKALDPKAPRSRRDPSRAPVVRQIDQLANLGGNASNFIEDRMRLGSLAQFLENGVDMEDAIARVNAMFVDYDIQSVADYWFRQVVPFARFTVGTAPVALRALRDRPLLRTLPRSMAAEGQREGDVSPEKVRRGLALPLGGGQYLQGLGLPLEDVDELLRTVPFTKGSALPGQRRIMGRLQQGIGAAIGAATDTNLYFGGPFFRSRKIEGGLADLLAGAGLAKTDDEGVTRISPGLAALEGALPTTRLGGYAREGSKAFEVGDTALFALKAVTGLSVRGTDRDVELRSLAEAYFARKAQAGDVGVMRRFYQQGTADPELQALIKAYNELTKGKDKKK